jgi:hypothetical protein
MCTALLPPGVKSIVVKINNNTIIIIILEQIPNIVGYSVKWKMGRLGDIGPLPREKCDLPSFGILYSVEWYRRFVTNYRSNHRKVKEFKNLTA